MRARTISNPWRLARALRRFIQLFVLVIAACIASACSAGLSAMSAVGDSGEEIPSGDDEPRQDLVHSDLPLFSSSTDIVWPQSFQDSESFGCASRIEFGIWVLRREDPEFGVDASWYLFANYGSIHCYAMVTEASLRDEVEQAPMRLSWFVPLGDVDVNGEARELWVIQIGARPGSDYLLLLRSPSDEGRITSFDMLQTDCPSELVRDAGALGIARTRYCSINDRPTFLAFARNMAKRPRLGILRLDVPEAGEAAA